MLKDTVLVDAKLFFFQNCLQNATYYFLLLRLHSKRGKANEMQVKMLNSDSIRTQLLVNSYSVVGQFVLISWSIRTQLMVILHSSCEIKATRTYFDQFVLGLINSYSYQNKLF